MILQEGENFMGTFIEYMCKTCGMKVSRGQNSGRPNPGRCPKSSNNLGFKDKWTKK